MRNDIKILIDRHIEKYANNDAKQKKDLIDLLGKVHASGWVDGNNDCWGDDGYSGEEE